MGWYLKLEETGGFLSLSLAQCRSQTTVIALGQEVLLPSHRPKREAADSPVGLGWVWAAGPPAVAFCSYVFLASLRPALWSVSQSRDCGGCG